MSVVYLITYEAGTGADGSGPRKMENTLTQDNPVVWLGKILVDYPEQRTIIVSVHRMVVDSQDNAGSYIYWCLEKNFGEIGDWMDWAAQSR